MKKVAIILTLCMMVISTIIASTPFKNGKIILIISVEVDNFETWKSKFDAGAPVREKAGIKVLSVCTHPENTRLVTVIEEAENAQSAHDFMLKLKAAKEKSGDTSVMKEVKLLDKAE